MSRPDLSSAMTTIQAAKCICSELCLTHRTWPRDCRLTYPSTHIMHVYSLYPGSASEWCVELACETKLKLGYKAADVAYEYGSHRSIRSDHLKATRQLVSSNASTCGAYAMNQMERIIASVFNMTCAWAENSADVAPSSLSQ